MNNSKKLKKHTAKDSVFVDLFSDKKYLLELYKALHPEDIAVSEDDLTTLTIKNILTNQIYNDLGFLKGDTLIILLEAQATWSMNIILRMLLYIAETYQRYFKEHAYNLYSSKKIHIPKPEFYMLYIGDRKEHPKYIHLSDEFFDGKDSDLEVKINVIYGENKNDIIGQYTAFTKIYDEQIKKYGPEHVREAVIETIQICKDKNFLKEYLEKREQEVVDIMITLFDEDEIMENFILEERREAAAEERQNGIRSLVAAYKDFNGTISDVIKRVISDYGLPDQEAAALVEKYW